MLPGGNSSQLQHKHLLEDDTSNKCLQRKAGVADKIDFKVRKVIQCKMGDFIEIMGTNHQEDVTPHIYMHPTWEHCNT